jgi:hypothetical protein
MRSFLFKIRLVCKKSIPKLYWSVIRPTVTYVCEEPWVFKGTVKYKLMVFARNVLRKILGPTKDRDCTWRMKTNGELDKLIRYKDIINHIKHKDYVGLAIYSEWWKGRMVKKYISGIRS